MKTYKLVLPDKSPLEVQEGTTPLDIAKKISPSLAKKSIISKINNNFVGMNDTIIEEGNFELILKDDPKSIEILRHSTSHLLAQALRRLYPKINFGVGPFTSIGFYYDTDTSSFSEKQISVEQFPEIEAEMMRIIKENIPIIKKNVSKEEALEIFKEDPYKVEIISGLPPEEKITIAQQGEFVDLDKGLLVPSTGWIKNFKLLSVAGAYWRGKSDNNMMQRIYGASEWSKEDLTNTINEINDRKERDHRVIGKDLGLFFNAPQTIGAGLPLWLPKGATIRREIENYITDKELRNSYKHVYTPIVSNIDVFKQSGHLDHYKDDMFPPMIADDGEVLQLRPMNCPFHIAIYNHQPRSYRELPYRIAEIGQMHRWEKSGSLTGLSRVREMNLNDGHTIVKKDQIQEEFQNILRLIMEVYKDFHIDDYRFRLSYRDPQNKDKYFDNDQMWEEAESSLKGAMDNLELDYFEAEGEAAFYGPKLDVQVKTALGNEETLSTIQLDFLLPEKFDMKYVGEDNKEHRPVLIHRGIIGTLERFVAYLIEQNKGVFPLWLSPVQVKVLPVSEDNYEYSKNIVDTLVKNGIRSELDERKQKLGYLIRDSQTQKTPFTLVIGDEERNGDFVTYREYSKQESHSLSLQEFQNKISNIIEEKN